MTPYSASVLGVLSSTVSVSCSCRPTGSGTSTSVSAVISGSASASASPSMASGVALYSLVLTLGSAALGSAALGSAIGVGTWDAAHRRTDRGLDPGTVAT